MMINLDKSFVVFRFITVNLFPVFLMLPHCAPSPLLNKRNYIQVLPVLTQADQGSAVKATINMAISMMNGGDQAFCSYKTSTGFFQSHSKFC